MANEGAEDGSDGNRTSVDAPSSSFIAWFYINSGKNELRIHEDHIPQIKRGEQWVDLIPSIKKVKFKQERLR